jgi:Gas vesicle synthesis protein GvpL/GvpF
MIDHSDTSAAGTPAADAARGSVYVYGVVAAGRPLGADVPAGVGDHASAVRLVDGDGIAAVVSDVPGDWHAATRADVETHERVLSTLVAERTVVPMRFGVTMDSDDQVRAELLERHAEEISELLRELDGRVQMSVKAYYTEEALLREVLKSRPDLKRRSDELQKVPAESSQAERIALGREVADAVEEQRARDEQTLAEPLSRVAVTVALEPPATERMALNAQLLVERGRRGELDDTVRQLAQALESRFAVRYVGPLAPYSFADLSLDTSEDQWA